MTRRSSLRILYSTRGLNDEARCCCCSAGGDSVDDLLVVLAILLANEESGDAKAYVEPTGSDMDEQLEEDEAVEVLFGSSCSSPSSLS